MAFDPSYGDAWLRPSYNNAEPDQAELGEHGRNEHVGFYQIDIFAPRNVSISVIEQMADALVQRFKRGTTLLTVDQVAIIEDGELQPDNRKYIRIDKSWWRYGPGEDAWPNRIIVRADYRAYLPN